MDKENELIELLGIQFEKYDTALKDMGGQVIRLSQENVIIKKRLNDLESKAIIVHEKETKGFGEL